MRALDLFCGAGGASMGLHRAGFEVIGCDIRAQPHYPFAFVQADAMAPPFRLQDFDLVWASPPCQAYTKSSRRLRDQGRTYPDLVADVRDLLEAAGTFWIIENVPGAPIRADVILDGTMFPSLRVIRERHFELGYWFTLGPSSRKEPGMLARGYSCVVGKGTPSWMPQEARAWQTADSCRQAMGIDWMTREELAQAIPPAYSQFLAERLLAWRAWQ